MRQWIEEEEERESRKRGSAHINYITGIAGDKAGWGPRF